MRAPRHCASPTTCFSINVSPEAGPRISTWRNRSSDSDRASLLRQKKKNDSTIDNGATYTQLSFLARVYTAQKQERHRESFLKGLDYLLKAQYPNGGWPQFYPDLSGYYKHITFNDDAMIGVMKLLRDVAAAKPAYAFVDEARRAAAARAVEKGIECILKTQVVVNGRAHCLVCATR